MSLEKRSLDLLWQLLYWQTIDTANAKLSALLNWVSSHVKDFPFSGPFQSEAGQSSRAETFRYYQGGRCRSLWAQGTIMAAIKGSRVGVSLYAASEANCPEPSAPLEPCPIHQATLRLTHDSQICFTLIKIPAWFPRQCRIPTQQASVGLTSCPE